MTSDFAIKTSNLTRTFGDKCAVDRVNLEIESGEIYGFLGPNGAGKSTAIRMLVTLLSPTSGDAWVMGRSIRGDTNKVRLQIGVALQEAALDGQQSGAELMRLQGRLYGLSVKEVKTRLAELRELVDIGEDFDEPVKTYSGGMKRRLDLALALVHKPRVLFLDEPTTGLDPASRLRVWEEIRQLNEELGITIFLTTQYLEEADQLAGRIGIISEGKIAAEGTPKELKQSVGTDLVVVQTDGDPKKVASTLKGLPHGGKVDIHDQEVTIATSEGAKIIGPVAVALEHAGIGVERLTLRTPTLDDVFLEVTGARLLKGAQEGL
jgi:ABC-2 type transport system ATP-binding protein